MIPTLPVCCLYVFPSPWEYLGPSFLLLMSRIQQRWWDVTFVIMLQKTDFLLTSTLSLAVSLVPEVRCHCEILTAEVHVAKNWGETSAKRVQGTEERLSAITRKEPSPITWVSWNENPAQLSLELTVALWDTQTHRSQLRWPWIPHHRSCEMMCHRNYKFWGNLLLKS